MQEYDRLASEHRDLVERLMTLAGETADSRREYQFADPRLFAIGLLDVFGSREAIPVFIRHIDWKEPILNGGLADPPLKGYPNASALNRHGRSAWPSILEYLERTPREEVSETAVTLVAWVLVWPFDEEKRGLRDAAAAVREAMNRAEHPENLERLYRQLQEWRGSSKRAKKP